MDDLNNTSEIPVEEISSIEPNPTEDFTTTVEDSNKDLFEFIGPKNFDYYYNILKKHPNSNSFASWNWCSFLFAPYWLLYRKLYLWFAAFVGASIIIDIIASMSTIASSILQIILIVVFGIFGNCMYIHHAKGRVKKINTALSEFTHKEEVLKANGGTNKLAPFILFLIIITFVIIIVMTVSMVLSLLPSLASPFHSILGNGML